MTYSPKQFVADSIRTESKSYVDLTSRITAIPRPIVSLAFKLLGQKKSALRNIRSLHGSLGISSELEEIVQFLQLSYARGTFDRVNGKEELGDILWYVAVITDALNLSPETVFTESETNHGEYKEPALDSLESIDFLEARTFAMVRHNGKLADLLKKRIFYGKSVENSQIESTLKSLVTEVEMSLRALGFTLPECMNTVIAKLKLRYPTKFTENNANKRNLAAERLTLETTK